MVFMAENRVPRRFKQTIVDGGFAQAPAGSALKPTDKVVNTVHEVRAAVLPEVARGYHEGNTAPEAPHTRVRQGTTELPTAEGNDSTIHTGAGQVKVPTAKQQRASHARGPDNPAYALSDPAAAKATWELTLGSVEIKDPSVGAAAEKRVSVPTVKLLALTDKNLRQRFSSLPKAIRVAIYLLCTSMIAAATYACVREVRSHYQLVINR